MLEQVLDREVTALAGGHFRDPLQIGVRALDGWRDGGREGWREGEGSEFSAIDRHYSWRQRDRETSIDYLAHGQHVVLEVHVPHFAIHRLDQPRQAQARDKGREGGESRVIR